jgi:hypothetical protein
MDPVAEPPRTRIASLAFAAVAVWQLTSAKSLDGLFAALLVIAVLYASEWLHHGLLPALGVAIWFALMPVSQAAGRLAETLRFEELAFVAVLGVALLIWSELSRSRFSKLSWLLLSLAAIIALTALWVEAHSSPTWLAGNELANDHAALQRLRQTTMGFFVIATLFGVWRSFHSKVGLSGLRLIAAAIALLTPVAAFGLARLFVPVRIDDLVCGARWNDFPRAVSEWAGGEPLVAWGPYWPVATLSAIGLWRLVARGFRQRAQKTMPLAWVLALGILVSMPVAGAGGGVIIPLFWSILLPVFGVADLLYLIGEELALRAPPSGPVHVPRV